MPVNSKCPKCGGTDYVRCGRSKAGTQRYLCKICHAKFSDTNDTVIFSKKLDFPTLHSMINLMINDTKLKAIVDLLHISSKTAYLWRMKIYTLTEKLQKDVILEGNVWIDEKYVHVNKSMVVMKEGMKEYRGLSRNQICVACGIDENKNRFAIVAGKGYISSKKCVTAYGRHIKEGSTIIHDGTFSHDKLVGELKAKSKIYKSTGANAHKGLQPINSFLAEIEHYIVVHPGIKTEYLQKYMSWIAFKSKLKCEEKIEEKVKELARLCYETDATFKQKDRH